MGKVHFLLFILVTYALLADGKRGSSSGSSWGRRGSSRGKSASTSSTSTSSGGWFSWGKTTNTGHASVPASAPKPAPAAAPSYGWTNPSSGVKPAGSWSQKPKPAPAYPVSYGANPSSSWHASAPKPGNSGSYGSLNPAPKPVSNPSYGWNAPASAPKPVYPPKPPAYPNSGYAPAVNPAYPPKSAPSYPSSAFNPASNQNHKPVATNPGWQKPSAPPLPVKPVATVPLQKSNPVSNSAPITGSGTGYGWSNPGQGKPVQNSNLPSSNIGAGGYPVQKSGHVNPPPYSPTNTHGTTYNQGRVAPPAYSPSNNHGGTSYSGPKKQVINNHYHYNSPPAYSPSHYGMSSSHYPTQNSFGYPGGGYFGNSRPSYGGMGMFSGSNGFGYPGSGSWGGYNSYGSSSGSGSMVKGLLIGAAGGYLANSLIRRVTNPWGYSGSGYGYGYTNRYDDRRYDERRREETAPPPTQAPYDPTAHWINCVAFDPVTKQTLINPNCTCTVSTTTDQVTGQNISHHDCTPPASMVPSPPLPVWGVNNQPPIFNGSLYGDGSAYGGGGYGVPTYGGQPQPNGPYPQGGQHYQGQGGQFQPQGGQFQPQGGQFQPQGGQFQPQGGHLQPQEGQPQQFQPYQPQGVIFTQGGQPFQPQVGTFVPQAVPIPEVVLPPVSTTAGPELAVAPTTVPAAVSEVPVSESLVSEDVSAKRKEFYGQLENIVNMGRFQVR